MERRQISQSLHRVDALVADETRPQRLLLRSCFAFVRPIGVRHLVPDHSGECVTVEGGASKGAAHQRTLLDDVHHPTALDDERVELSKDFLDCGPCFRSIDDRHPYRQAREELEGTDERRTLDSGIGTLTDNQPVPISGGSAGSSTKPCHTEHHHHRSLLHWATSLGGWTMLPRRWYLNAGRVKR